MLKSSIVYTLVSLLNKGIPFILLPFLTAYLTPTDYGVLALIQILISFIFPVQNLNGNLFIAKKHVGLSQKEIFNYIISHIQLVGYISLIVFIFIFIFLYFFPAIWGFSYWWLIAILLVGILNAFYLDYTTLLRCENKVWQFAFLEIAKTFVNVGLSLFLVILYLKSWESRIFSILIATSLLGLVVVFLFKRRLNFNLKLNASLVKEILRFCLPLLPFSIGMIVINLSDRFFIDALVGKEALGIYSVAYTVGMMIILFAESFNKAWTPYFFQLMVNYELHKKKILKVLIAYSFVLLLIPIFIYLISVFVIFPYLINFRYEEALQYVIGISYSYVFYGIYLVLFQFLAWKDKTKIVGAIFIFGAIFNLLLNYFLIDIYGLQGAVISTVITYFLMMLMTLGYVYKFYNRSI